MYFKIIKSKTYRDLLKRHSESLQALTRISKLYQEEQEKLALLETKIEMCWTKANSRFPIQLFRKDGICYLVVIEQSIRFNYESCVASLYEMNKRSSAERSLAHINFKITDTDAYLCDVLTSINNRGYGSMLMQALFRYLSYRGSACLKGELSDVDLNDHKDRLLHFYKKQGFIIIEKTEPDWVEIRKCFTADTQGNKTREMEQISFYPDTGTRAKLAKYATKNHCSSINAYLIDLVDKQLKNSDSEQYDKK